MLFSIIVPVYNVENYIRRCVDSLIEQTYRNVEIILVDDGSPDRSPRICDEYAQRDDRITVIHKPNGGLSDARNAGLLRASGEYVLFVDSDDSISPDTVERFYQFAKMDHDIVVGDGTTVGGTVKLAHISEYGAYTGEEFLKRSLLQNKMPMAAVICLYKREFLMQNALFFKVGILHEDENFTPQAFLKARSVYNSGICFYRYYIHSGTITTKADLSRNASDMYETCCQLAELYQAIDDKELKALLLDSLVVKYLSIFQAGKIYQYGKQYIHKKFVFKYSRSLKTRLKSVLFCINCRLYYQTNQFFKALRKK